MNKEFNKTAQEFKVWNKKFLIDQTLAVNVATAGQTRVIGRKDGLITRINPSAARPVKENYQDAMSFILDHPEIDDLSSDDDLVVLHNLLQDYMFLLVH